MTASSQPPTRSSPDASRPGVLSARSVRVASFFVIGAGMFVTAAVCVLAIWEHTSPDAAWRAVATLGVITGTLLLFGALNEWFGMRLQDRILPERKRPGAIPKPD